LSELTSGKKWNDWKLDYLKWHLKQTIHVCFVIKSQNLKKGGIVRILTETQEDRKLRAEVTESEKSNADLVKILIGNVIPAIKINTSMLSVQDIHYHFTKYTSVPESWRSSYVDSRRKYRILFVTIFIIIKL
jgi:hypothetical protein